MFHLNFIIALFVQIIMIGKTFYRISPCSAAFASLMLAQVHAFMKLFLKFSERKAYKIGLMQLKNISRVYSSVNYFKDDLISLVLAIHVGLKKLSSAYHLA